MYIITSYVLYLCSLCSVLFMFTVHYLVYLFRFWRLGGIHIEVLVAHLERVDCRLIVSRGVGWDGSVSLFAISKPMIYVNSWNIVEILLLSLCMYFDLYTSILMFLSSIVVCRTLIVIRCYSPSPRYDV